MNKTKYNTAVLGKISHILEEKNSVDKVTLFENADKIIVKNSGKKFSVKYLIPKKPSDLKRVGRKLILSFDERKIFDGRKIELNGNSLRCLKSILKKMDDVLWKVDDCNDEEGCYYIKNKGDKTKILFTCPKNYRDLKRVGRTLYIKVKNSGIVLNGNQINSLESVLQKAKDKVL